MCCAVAVDDVEAGSPLEICSYLVLLNIPSYIKHIIYFNMPIHKAMSTLLPQPRVLTAAAQCLCCRQCKGSNPRPDFLALRITSATIYLTRLSLWPLQFAHCAAVVIAYALFTVLRGPMLYQGLLREAGYLLHKLPRKKDQNDFMISVPAMKCALYLNGHAGWCNRGPIFCKSIPQILLSLAKNIQTQTKPLPRISLGRITQGPQINWIYAMTITRSGYLSKVIYSIN